MKREDLFRAIGEIDEDLLAENVITVKRNRILPTILSVAACVAVVVGAVFIMPQKIPSDNLQTEPSEMMMETVAEIEDYYASPVTTTEIPAVQTEEVSQIHYPNMPTFLEGKYQAVDESGNVRDFWFFGDGSGGRFEDAQNGMGLGFTFEYLEIYNEDGSTDVIFHMGTIDDNTRGKIAHDENGNLILTWEDGTKERFTYLGDSLE